MNHSVYEDGAMPIHKNAGTTIPFARRRRVIFLAIAAASIMTWSSFLWARPDSQVEYPQGYRNWTHVMSYLIGPQSPAYEKSGGLHHFYANEKAMEGYRAGKFPDGSMIVDERNKAQENDGVTRAGERLGIGVMVKDSRRYAETGGWGFEIFRGDNQTGALTAQGRAACYNCHAKRQDRDFVYTTIRK